LEECGPWPVVAGYTLAFVLKLTKKLGTNSVRVAEVCQKTEYTEQNIHNNKNT